LTIVNIVGAIPVEKIAQFEEHYVRGLRDERKPEKSKEGGNEKK
jgi:hypothetical protein